MHCALSILAQRCVIQLSHHVPRHVVQAHAHNRLINSSGSSFNAQCDCTIQLSRAHACSLNGFKIDQTPRRLHGMEEMSSRGQVVLDEALAGNPAFALFVEFAPRITAGVIK